MFIADPIIALKDCWIIGDLFVSEIYHELPAQNQENRSANAKQLYIYRNYNVKCFSTHLLAPPKANPVARLVNALVNAVNENRYLPRLIVIIPDRDIVKQVQDVDVGVFTVLEHLIKWTIVMMNRGINTHRDDLTKFSEGAVTYAEPKWLWVKMLDRVSVIDKALAMRGKFNRALENMLVGRHSHYLIDLNKNMSDPAYYSSHLKTLNGDGKARFWLELDKVLKKFDYQDEETCNNLKPKKKEYRRKSSFRKMVSVKLSQYAKNNNWQ